MRFLRIVAPGLFTLTCCIRPPAQPPARLTVMHATDGVSAFPIAYFDHVLGAPCLPARGADDVVRCEPAWAADVLFTDPSCAGEMISVRAADQDELFASPIAYARNDEAFFFAGAMRERPAMIFEKEGDRCTGVAPPESGLEYRRVGARLTPDRFVAFSAMGTESAGLIVERLTTSAGPTVDTGFLEARPWPALPRPVADLRLADSGAVCTPHFAHDGAFRCLPGSMQVDFFFAARAYADNGCSTPVARFPASRQAPAVVLLPSAELAGAVEAFSVSNEEPAETYVRRGEACDSASTFGAASVLLRKVAPLAAATFPGFERALYPREAQGRLQAWTLVSGAVERFAPTGGQTSAYPQQWFFDRTLGADCRLERDRDATLRCFPAAALGHAKSMDASAFAAVTLQGSSL